MILIFRRLFVDEHMVVGWVVPTIERISAIGMLGVSSDECVEYVASAIHKKSSFFDRCKCMVARSLIASVFFNIDDFGCGSLSLHLAIYRHRSGFIIELYLIDVACPPNQDIPQQIIRALSLES